MVKIIRMRRAMMRRGVSRLNVFRATQAIRAIEPWLNAYPHATNMQVCAHISRHIGAVLTILPGKNTPTHEGLLRELNEILKPYQKCQQSTKKSAANSTM